MKFITVHLMPEDEDMSVNVAVIECYKSVKPGPKTPIGAKGVLMMSGRPLLVKEDRQELESLIEGVVIKT